MVLENRERVHERLSTLEEDFFSLMQRAEGSRMLLEPGVFLDWAGSERREGILDHTGLWLLELNDGFVPPLGPRLHVQGALDSIGKGVEKGNLKALDS